MHPNGPGTTGRPVLIDKTDGTIHGGMGGKFDGQNINALGKEKAKDGNKPDLVEHRKKLLGMAAEYDR